MENRDKGDAGKTAHRDTMTPDDAPYRSRYVPSVEVRDPRPDRRFIIALLAWGGFLDVVGGGTWAKVTVGAFIALALVIYGVVRVTRPMS